MDFLFITREGRECPGARMRCWGFSEKLKDKGINADVFSFVDKLGARSGKDDDSFHMWDKLRCVFNGYRLLSRVKDNTVFIINRFNYHTIAPWLISAVRGIPVIFDMDDWEAREAPGSKAEHLTRLLAKRSVFCVAASRYLKDYLSQFNKNVYHIPTPVDTDKFKPAPHRERKDFVFSWHGSINRMEIISYLEFIIECFLTLYKKYPFIKLYIAADGIFKKELLRMISKYDCAAIIYKGWIHYNDIACYLDDVDCGLVPLLDKTCFNLSKSPVKLFEYMAKAKPVVASNIGQASLAIKDGYNGFLAVSRVEFVAKMEQIVRNRVLASDIGANARKTIEKEYSLSVLSEKVADILQDFFSYDMNSKK